MDRKSVLLLCLLLAPLAYGAEAPTDNTSDQPQVVIEATKTNMERASPNPTASATVLTNNPLAVPPPVSPGSHTPATVAIETERPGFKKNMSEVVNRSPELEKMLETNAAAWRQYTDVYRKLNGSDPVADTNFPEPAGTSPPAHADDDEEEQ